MSAMTSSLLNIQQKVYGLSHNLDLKPMGNLNAEKKPLFEKKLEYTVLISVSLIVFIISSHWHRVENGGKNDGSILPV